MNIKMIASWHFVVEAHRVIIWSVDGLLTYGILCPYES